MVTTVLVQHSEPAAHLTAQTVSISVALTHAHRQTLRCALRGHSQVPACTPPSLLMTELQSHLASMECVCCDAIVSGVML